YMARRVLLQSDRQRYREAIARADAWLLRVDVQNLVDAAAVLLALHATPGAEAERRRERCLALVRKGQSKDGGWGPYVTAPSEPFDTALVLLALKQYPKLAGTAKMIRHGRDYLLATQKTDGSWQETTRPAGGDSYAQRISTTGWATLALL